MANRDLTYLIAFDTSGTEQLGTAADDMEALADAATAVEEAPALDLDLGSIETAPEDIAAVGTSLEELPIEEQTGRWGGLSDVLGEFGLASIGVGEAIDIAATAIDVGRQAFDFFTADAREAERRTREFGDALLETSGLLESIEGVFAGSTEPVDAFTQAFLELDDVDLERTVAALGDVGLQADDLGQTLLNLATTDDPLRLLQDMADAAGVASENLGIVALDGTNMATVLGDATDEQQEFIDGFNRLAADLDGLDFDDIAEQQLEVAEGFDAMAVAQARAAAGEDATDLEVWTEYQRIVTEATAATEAEADAEEALAAQQVALTEGARELSSALGSIQWENAELAGATSGMAAFSDGLFAVDNATQSVEEAFARFAGAVGDDPLNLDVTTEAGRRQQDALEGVAGALDGQFTQAFDAANGSQEAFIAAATEIGDATLARLTDQLDLSAEEAAVLAEALGLTAGDYEARFELSADQTAIERLGLLQSAIAGLPSEVSTQVNTLIAAGDPQAALDAIIAFYSDPANAPTVEVGTEVDTTGIDEAATEATEQEYTVEFATEAPDAAETSSELDEVADEREAPFSINLVEYIVALALMEALAAPRTASVTAEAFTFAAENALDAAAAARDAPIDAFLREAPSRSDIVSAVTGGTGVVRVPIDTYVRNSARLSGSRAV